MPKYFSTNNTNHLVSLKEAIFKGLAPDNGLYMPLSLETLPLSVLRSLKQMSFKELGVEISKLFLKDDLTPSKIEQIVDEAINFETPLVELTKNISVLELFHGPTCAFKDFGGRFMSRVMRAMLQHQDKKMYILVATSGDTGSAVASGFYNVEGIEVIILYPSKKVSHIQEQQLTTLGNNIRAIEIEGTFDDCQRLVKQAFLDKNVQSHLSLTSANSINIARLIPQSFYYAYVGAQYGGDRDVVIAVPSGNFGNLTGGLIAKQVGIPINHFVASNNANKIFFDYINTGNFTPKASINTISNAMDVGNPSNVARIQHLYNGNIETIKKDITAYTFDDIETKKAMQRIYASKNYVLDPHGAVAYLGAEAYVKDFAKTSTLCVALETAHPAKFGDIVKQVLDIDVPVPKQLQACLQQPKKATLMPSLFEDFKSFLLNLK